MKCKECREEMEKEEVAYFEKKQVCQKCFRRKKIKVRMPKWLIYGK